MFADDTTVYLTVGKQNNSQQLQDDMDQLQKWEKLGDMDFNPGEVSVLLCILLGRRLINSQYTMHDQVLCTVDTAKYLGVDISDNLNFNQHINKMTSNANKTLDFLQLNIRTKKILVTAKQHTKF